MRQFISDSFPDKDGILVVKGKNFRYFMKVLRFKIGDMVSVRLPDGKLVYTTLAVLGNNEAKLSVTEYHPERTDSSFQTCFGISFDVLPAPTIILFQFQPKSAKFDQIVRQATECGVAMIVPIIGEFSQHFEKSEKKSRADRFSRIIKEARQQSGSSVATEVLSPMSVDEAINYWKKNAENKKSGGVVLYERNENSCSMVEAVKNLGDADVVALVVGGEGGISPAEIKTFIENEFKVVHFETNILRCETAALYGIASLQTLLTEKNKWLLKE